MPKYKTPELNEYRRIRVHMAVKGSRAKFTLDDLQKALRALVKAVGVFGYELAYTVNLEADLIAAKRGKRRIT